MKRWSLFLLRVSMGWLLVLWGIEKLVSVEHALRVADTFYLGIGSRAIVQHVLGGAEILLGIAVVIGFKRTIAYPIAFAVLALSGLGVWKSSRAALACALALAAVATSAVAQAPDDRARDGRPDRRVAVTFDDLPANSFRPSTEAFRRVTEPLVAGLVRHGIPAIGFVNESKLHVDGELDPDRVAYLRAWVEAGLELGNHTYSHPDLHRTPLESFQADVLRGERVTRALLAEVGREPRYFRHPFLHTGRSLEVRDGLEAFLAEHGYRVAPVTIDNQEWIFARAYDHALARDDAALAGRIAGAYLTYMDTVFGYYEAQSRALLGYELPQVLLLHANQLNADVLDGLVAAIRARGYAFVPLEEALDDPAYASEDTWTGSGGITWLHRWALTRGHRGDFFAGEPEATGFVQEVFANPPP